MIYPIELAKLYEPYISEYEKAFSEFVRKGYFINGDYVDAFEEKMAAYLEAKYVVGCGNGTDAMELTMRAYGIGIEDQVITVGNTYYATARAIVNVGAQPVFCDVDDNALIDIDKIEEYITDKTKAIIPVHLYGLPVQMNKIRSLAGKYGLKVIEDCSHAFGTRVDHVLIGRDSECACFSLYPTKNIGAFGDAGFIATNSKELADVVRAKRYYACDESRNSFQENSMHSRLDSFQAAMLIVSLEHIEEWNKRRIINKEKYIKRFKGTIPYLSLMEEKEVVPYVFPIIVEDQQKFYDYLKENGIQPQIHYKPDLHKIEHLGPYVGKLNKTEYFNSHVVSIPISPTVTIDEIDYISDVVNRYFVNEE